MRTCFWNLLSKVKVNDEVLVLLTDPLMHMETRVKYVKLEEAKKTKIELILNWITLS